MSSTCTSARRCAAIANLLKPMVEILFAFAFTLRRLCLIRLSRCRQSLQVWHFRLMDYHLMERIVRDSNRCRITTQMCFLEPPDWLLQALAKQAAVVPALITIFAS
jgi:hypothetical protein